MTGKAIFSIGREYRYGLARVWGDDSYALFIGLNPASADETKGDHTIRRCLNFSRRWNVGGMWVVNLFAYRSPYPEILFQQKDPVGEYNDEYISHFARYAKVVVACWGSLGHYRDRDFYVNNLIKRKMYCFGLTQGGFPKHPLYLRNGTPLKPYVQGERR